jgi:phosphoribosylamine--glycine ligase
MLTTDGPRVLEFNARFGDPEAELILPLMDSSLLEVCLAVCEGRLDQARLRWREGVTCGVVLAAPGYPERPRLGAQISGLDRLPRHVLAFQAGTRQAGDTLVQRWPRGDACRGRRMARRRARAGVCRNAAHPV